MANQDAARGFQLVHCDPSKIFPCYVPATDSTALGVGDPVVITANGSNSAVVKTGVTVFEPGTIREVTRTNGADTNRISGIVVECEGTPAAHTQKTRPASTAGVVYVCMDPDAIYEVQTDGTATATMVGLNAVAVAGSINSVTGESGFELDVSSDVPAADASNPFRILGVSKDPRNNDLSSANVNVYVKLNLSTEASSPDGTLGV